MLSIVQSKLMQDCYSDAIVIIEKMLRKNQNATVFYVYPAAKKMIIRSRSF